MTATQHHLTGSGAAAVIVAQNGQRTSCRVSVGGLLASPVRATSVEAALQGKELTGGSIAAAATLVANDLNGDILHDIHASADYWRAMAPVYMKRALESAAMRA